MKNAAIIVLIIIICSVVGAVMHEKDIAEQCRKHGKSNYATWTVSLTCTVDGK